MSDYKFDSTWNQWILWLDAVHIIWFVWKFKTPKFRIGRIYIINDSTNDKIWNIDYFIYGNLKKCFDGSEPKIIDHVIMTHIKLFY